MSEYTTDQFLDVIEKAGGPEKLYLYHQDLRGIDLSAKTIQRKRATTCLAPTWLA